MAGEVCEVCYSLVHFYLTACPACGTHRSSNFGWAVYDWVHREDPYSYEEARRRLGSPDGKQPTESSIVDWMEEPRWERIRQSATRWIEPQPGPLAETREILFGRRLLDKHLVDGKSFTYLGGLPSYPNALEVIARASESGLQVLERRSGSVVAVIPYASILAATGTSDQMRLGWFGLALGNAIALSQPTIEVGAWILTFASNGVPRQVAFGARQAGFFGSTQTPEYFKGLSLFLATPVEHHIRYAEAMEGPIEYARRLGLPVDTEEIVGAAESKPDEPDSSVDDEALISKFGQLKALLDHGYITQGEFDTKRAELLARM